MQRHLMRAFPTILFLLLFARSLALGQSDNAQIAGYVKDASGALIGGVSITASSETTTFERTVVSNPEGYYVISQVPPGRYTITAEFSGFRKFRESGRTVEADL